ncbi:MULTISPECIES: hypothetical protein [Burkholderia]|jgi:hypothetical protein|uniref:hypothetical protein n=1 Tax=Burkholderia TaxID=32008 RepID=UPI000AE7BDC1|nr:MULTISPECIES: hypothetical protein [Burkholderia]MBG0872981.1 hypothetical protein [Burkholderia sp. 9777_1386]MBG0880715.1 hypothetical protein [Burkholderia sp. 9775_39]MBG0886996.1 hypothetical protein [Burkholderia sp. 9773_38]MBR7940571.1 hypothetical protein [Burkholderia cenocepacia]MBR7947865.1 hypothetical protein [Burkholderia cenocepacia]
MQRQILQAACRPDDPEVTRAARISFQTAACATTYGVMRAVGGNRTARAIADRLDGVSTSLHDERRRVVAYPSRGPAAVHRQACAQRHRAPARHRIGSCAPAVRRTFRTGTPSRGYDACRIPQPVFEHPSHPAPCRATRITRSASPRSPSVRVRRDGRPISQAQLEETT